MGDLAACIPPCDWERAMGWDGRAGVVGSWCPSTHPWGTVDGCMHAPAVRTAGPEEPVSQGREAAGHGPRRMGGRNGYWSTAQGSLCWN